MPKSYSNYHLVGVAGVGMSALAQLLLARGDRVSGSDRYYDQSRDLLVLKKLQALGLTLFAQAGRGVRPDLDAVVVSSAIEADNPDLVAARAAGIKILHRAELLARLVAGKQCLAVTGTAGKTTVAGMLGFCLEQAGFDPTVVNGGAVLNWVDAKRPGNFRPGRSDCWVLELDESDRSLLRFFPDWAVITNVSQDHFELEEVRALFAAFAKQVKNGIIGWNPLVDIRPPEIDFQPAVTERGVSFRYRRIEFQLSLLGQHNIENALRCVMLCEKLGLDLNKVSRALEKFQGIERRMQIVGRANGITVIDDYAHNPAKIAAVLAAAGALAGRLVAVWRPHGFAPLALMYRDLRSVFLERLRPADRLLLLPVYFAGGTARPAKTAEMLADDLIRRGRPVDYVEDYPALGAALEKIVRPGDAVLFLGARDPDLPAFARRFVLELGHFVVDRVAGPGGIAQKN